MIFSSAWFRLSVLHVWPSEQISAGQGGCVVLSSDVALPWINGQQVAGVMEGPSSGPLAHVWRARGSTVPSSWPLLAGEGGEVGVCPIPWPEEPLQALQSQLWGGQQGGQS